MPGAPWPALRRPSKSSDRWWEVAGFGATVLVLRSCESGIAPTKPLPVTAARMVMVPGSDAYEDHMDAGGITPAKASKDHAETDRRPAVPV